jgi:DNA topoisomerase IA
MKDLKFTTAGEYMNDRIKLFKESAGVQDNPDQVGIDQLIRMVVGDCAGIVYNNCDDDAEGEEISQMILNAYGIGSEE